MQSWADAVIPQPRMQDKGIGTSTWAQSRQCVEAEAAGDVVSRNASYWYPQNEEEGGETEISELKYMKYLKKRCGGGQMILLFKKWSF